MLTDSWRAPLYRLLCSKTEYDHDFCTNDFYDHSTITTAP